MASQPDTDEKSDLLIHHENPAKSRLSTKTFALVGVSVAIVLVIVIAVGVGVGVSMNANRAEDSATYNNAAVAADAEACSKAGVEMLDKGGSAVDAAIAGQLCVGVVNLHSAGIGGGGFMIYYNDTSGESFALDFREVAPLAASTYMYNNTASDSHIRGGLSVAIPGQIRGFKAAWERFGKLEWNELFEPAIRIATEGIKISNAVAKAIESEEDYILSGNYLGLEELLAPDGSILREGDTLKRPLLAETLSKIADNGANYFYEGEFMEQMVIDLQANGAIINASDFEGYSVEYRPVTRAFYDTYDVLGISAPGGGPVLGLMLNILDGYDFKEGELDGLSIHRIVEAMKYAYAQRLKLGDPAFNDTVNQAVQYMLNETTAVDLRGRINDSMTYPPDHYIDPFSPLQVAHDRGTSHLSVLAENGDAVSMTNSINYYFGSLVRSSKSGILFNNQMTDFNIPGRSDSFNETAVNYIVPKKRPLSSMTPTVLLGDDGVKMVVGASGGSRITTSVAQVILNVLGFSLPLNEAIYRRRLHHQLIPNYVSVETDFPEDITSSLEFKGHTVLVNNSFAVVQGINVVDGLLHATSDPRKGGKPDGY